MVSYVIQTFYSFEPVTGDLEALKAELCQRAQTRSVMGLLILSAEGFNTTIASTNEGDLTEFQKDILSTLKLSSTSLVKTSTAEKRPFKRFNVKVRSEIVTLGKEEYLPTNDQNHHLSPADWQKYLESDDVVVVDTRNTYETEIGKFSGAIELGIDEFREFPEKIKELDTDKSKPHLIYCTGGIRCEKAIFEMQKQGFEKTYQLEGGILNYLEHMPNKSYEGECFVFDSRVSLDQNLNVTQRYSLCPHCGDVGLDDLNCLKCDHEFKMCKPCQEKIAKDKSVQTCSKNCRYHYQRDPSSKSPQQRQYYHD